MATPSNPRGVGYSIRPAGLPKKRLRKCPKCGAEPGMKCRSVRVGKVEIYRVVADHKER